ncbi:hypothetical protein C6P46_000356 [Rhodotorula mucilaginosa]|uniref:F-box domain-containing protein n=1 Tax=Rhodotorula mucilaginosa TaxID=5537 RepID=A0A9P6VWT2_RHOMI|nr:hypothetical protein C6P46_000356 [Rhodotorula mucilaginosa]
MQKRPRTSSPERLDHARPASSSSSASGAATNATIASRPRARTGTGSEGQNRLRYKSNGKYEAMPDTRSNVLPIRSLEGSLSEEVLLRCLSFLSAHDLVTVARVSSAWYRLAQDPQLWRNLYLTTYASAATRRQAAFGTVPLPRSRPWRELYQISTNWRNGTARATALGTELRKAVLPPVPSSTEVVDNAREAVRGRLPVEPEDDDDDTLLQFHHQYIFSASRSGSAVTVHETRPNGSSNVVGSFESTRLGVRAGSRPTLSEMRLDASSSFPMMMALFYSTGQYALFRLDLPTSSSRSRPFSAIEVYTSTSFLSDPVTTARMHWPLLVTLTDSLTLRFMRLSGDRQSGPVEVDETETPLQSRERWSPVILSLERADGAHDTRGKDDDATTHFSVSLAYSTPVFPASWTVGMQRFELAVSPARLKVVRAQHATAPPAHTPWPSTLTRTRLFGAYGGPTAEVFAPRPRKSLVTSIEHSHPFIVTSRTDNTIDVYEVVRLEAPTSSLHVVHRRTLFGHTARVSSVALLPTADAGSPQDNTSPIRCISAGDDGAVKVWRLLPSEEDARTDGSGSRKRKRTAAPEADLQVQIRRQDASATDVPQLSDYQQLKRRRTATTQEPARVQRVWVDEDKIVLLQRPSVGGESRAGEVQMLRFD